MSQKKVVPVFFTLNDGKGARNQWGSLVIEKLQSLMRGDAEKNCWAARVVSSPAKVSTIVALLARRNIQGVPIAIFDCDNGQRVNRWHPQPSTARTTPAWARGLARWTVGIGRQGVSTETRIMSCAQQIAGVFKRMHLLSSETEQPWGPARTAKRKKRHREHRHDSFRSYAAPW